MALSLDAIRCPECKAVRRPGVDRCWLCGAPQTAETPRVVAARPPVASEDTEVSPIETSRQIFEAEVVDDPPEVRCGSFWLALLLASAVMIAVGVGLWQQAPGISVLLLGVVLPVVWIASARLQSRDRQRQALSIWEAALQLLAATLLVTGVLSIVAIAFFVILFIQCVHEFRM